MSCQSTVLLVGILWSHLNIDIVLTYFKYFLPIIFGIQFLRTVCFMATFKVSIGGYASFSISDTIWTNYEWVLYSPLSYHTLEYYRYLQYSNKYLILKKLLDLSYFQHLCFIVLFHKPKKQFYEYSKVRVHIYSVKHFQWCGYTEKAPSG